MVYAAVDIETKDPYLKVYGPGAIRFSKGIPNTGYILGVGVYCPEKGIEEFFDITSDKLRNLLVDPDIVKICHNAVYDIDWIMNGYGLPINGRIEDTMTRETLLDSYALSYSLDSCCVRRGVIGKNKDDTIDKWWRDQGYRSKAIEHLDEIPRSIVAKYCLQDCRATYDLFQAQQPALEQENLVAANDIEVRLYPVLMAMRRNGIRLDWEARTVLSNKLNDEHDQIVDNIRRTYDISDLNINANADLEMIWKREGLPIEYTEKGNPSFNDAVLDRCNHPIAGQIQHLRSLEKVLGTYIDGAFVDMLIGDHIHCSLYPAKRDVSGGTVTGRWSSQQPNMQNVPAREDKWGKEVRSLFIPEEGCLIGAFDYKQIEYRIFTHFASGPGALEAQKLFQENPNTDYHQMTIDLMGWGDMGKAGRYLAKNFNFGSIYGLGANSFAVKFAKNLLHAHPDADPDNLVPLAKSLMNEYYAKVPFARHTVQSIQNTALRRGYVRGLSGRRHRLPPDGKTYKLVNYLVQGSAADVLKKGLVDAWDAGVFDVLKIHVPVHDENVFSIPITIEGAQACQTFYECMRNAYTLKIPLGVDTEIGPDWGHCTEENYVEFRREVGYAA